MEGKRKRKRSENDQDTLQGGADWTLPLQSLSQSLTTLTTSVKKMTMPMAEKPAN